MFNNISMPNLSSLSFGTFEILSTTILGFFILIFLSKSRFRKIRDRNDITSKIDVFLFNTGVKLCPPRTVSYESKKTLISEWEVFMEILSAKDKSIFMRTRPKYAILFHLSNIRVTFRKLLISFQKCHKKELKARTI